VDGLDLVRLQSKDSNHTSQLFGSVDHVDGLVAPLAPTTKVTIKASLEASGNGVGEDPHLVAVDIPQLNLLNWLS
jgi:hypothetical protein